MSWKKAALIIGAVLVVLGYFGLEIIKRESSFKEEAAKKEVEEVKMRLAQAEKEIQETRERAEKERQKAEREHQERLAEMRKLAAEEEARRKEEEARKRQEREVAETKAQLEKGKTEQSLEEQKEKMRVPALSLKFKYGPLSGEEKAVALVRTGDKVTVRFKKLETGEVNSERYYVRLGPGDKIQQYGRGREGIPRDLETRVLFLNDQDSFTISKKLAAGLDIPEDGLETEKGCILYIGSMLNFWQNPAKKGTVAFEMDIYETNQWNAKPKSLL